MVSLGKALFFLSCLLFFATELPAQTDHFLMTEEPSSAFASPAPVIALPLLPRMNLKIIPPLDLEKFHNTLLFNELRVSPPQREAGAYYSRRSMTAAQEITMAYRIDAWALYPELALPRHNPASKVLNAFYVKPTDESEKIRQMWKEAFGGMDVWLPYYNVKKIEKWCKDKASFKVFKMKCSPKFEKGSFTYTCKRTF